MQGFQNEHEDIFMDDFDEVLLNSMAQDPGGNPDAFAQDKPNTIPQGEEKLNEDAQMKFDNLPHYLEALYPGLNIFNRKQQPLGLSISKDVCLLDSLPYEMVHSSYLEDLVVQCLAMHNVDFDIDHNISETNVLLDYVPILDPEEPEAIEFDSFLSVDPDPKVEI
ncbi:hypothetical protein FRX31_012069 [Thalictrum thalictroides]|uniref:Uncharacterized protein n=1 Tax=Thalictrum thalictroides TaxID=46969 RepID=A0A7J6WLV9_THATH|nr:hypothetical protein FRX31_012069 [Thalictrum thalictroides]